MSSSLNGYERMFAERLSAEHPTLTWHAASDHRRAACWGREGTGTWRILAMRWWENCAVDIIIYDDGMRIIEHRRFHWPSSLEHGDAWSSLPAAGDVVPS